MKRLISGILCTALMATCFCGCGKSSDEEKDSKETLYLLKEVVQKNDDGEVLCRETYEYNKAGLVTVQLVDAAQENTIWDDVNWVYITEFLPCDGEIDYQRTYDYDKKGNPTYVDTSFDTPAKYEYTYDAKGRIATYTMSYENPLSAPNTYELDYESDGSIKIWNTLQSRDEDPARIFETDGTANGRISKIIEKNKEGKSTYCFDYDPSGKRMEFYFYWGSMEPSVTASFEYDKAGRVIKESGFRTGSSDQITYQYDDDMLVAINDEELVFTEGNQDEMIVRYKDYELTYMPVKLTKQEVNMARHRWNQFCGGFNSNHSYSKGLNGVQYPVFDANTELLLPKVIFG